ncbi:hypothetical protein NW759_015075 [Fusarium solani]|nr:hypothetical protein NW759_015075 [Fusarium solani]
MPVSCLSREMLVESPAFSLVGRADVDPSYHDHDLPPPSLAPQANGASPVSRPPGCRRHPCRGGAAARLTPPDWCYRCLLEKVCCKDGDLEVQEWNYPGYAQPVPVLGLSSGLPRLEIEELRSNGSMAAWKGQ